MYLNKKIVITFITICVLLAASSVIFMMFNNEINIEKAKESVMLIYAYDEYGELIGTGSGFIAFEDDILITNAHVVEDASRIEVISEKNNKYGVLGIIGYSEKNDIAIFKLSEHKDLKKFSISKKIKVGEEVYAIGSPLGIKNTVSNGILSGIREEEFEIYQYTAPISPGSSGGALLNKKGEVVGITYASMVEGQNLNLAIKISDVENLYRKQEKQLPIPLNYSGLLASKLKISSKISDIIKNLDVMVRYNSGISREASKKDNLKIVAELSGNNGELWGFNILEGVTDSGGVCNMIGQSWYDPNIELGKCFTSEINPKYKYIGIQIYEKTSDNLKNFGAEIENTSSLANFFIHSSYKSEREYYEDSDYYYYVQYANIEKSEIDSLFQKK